MEEGETRMVGKWLATYRKEGGRWRLATDCWNFDAPMMATRLIGATAIGMHDFDHVPHCSVLL